MKDGELVEFVLAFAEEVNALQRRYAPLLASERVRGRSAAFLEAYRAEAGLIYARYLTKRERTYYAPISDPPTYAAMDEMTLSTVERVKNRAVVDILTSEGSRGSTQSFTSAVGSTATFESGGEHFPARFFALRGTNAPSFPTKRMKAAFKRK